MTELFGELNVIKQRVVEYMLTINENVNWLDFFNQYGTLPDVKILRRIRSLVWVDKSIEYDTIMYSTVKYFKYYVMLLMKFRSFALDHPIYILGPKLNKPAISVEEVVMDIKIRYSILKRIMTLFQMNFIEIDMDKLTDADVKNMKLLLPLGSLTYRQDELDVFKSFDCVVIPDGFNNICFTREDEIFNNIVINVQALMLSPDDITEIIHNNYTMFYINKP